MNFRNLNGIPIRTAKPGDINQMQVVRNSVKENILSNPDLVTDELCLEFITKRGKGWVCEIDNRIVGFSIVDLKDRNIWALFVHPDFEKKGVGNQLQRIMLNWYFDQTRDNIWLSTNPNTRAETFYLKSGWTPIGTLGNGEIKFEMTYENWKKYNR